MQRADCHTGRMQYGSVRRFYRRPHDDMVLELPVQLQYNMHVMNAQWTKLRKDLQMMHKSLDKMGAMHRKKAAKQLKMVKNLRNSWGYSPHMANGTVHLQQVVQTNTEILRHML